MKHKQLVEEFRLDDGQFKTDCCTYFRMSQGQVNSDVSRFLFCAEVFFQHRDCSCRNA